MEREKERKRGERGKKKEERKNFGDFEIFFDSH